MSNKKINQILSHRLRGFDNYEHTEKAITEAIKSDILYLEIDTRVSKDKIIYVYHDATYPISNGKKINITQVNSNFIQKTPHLYGHTILTLDRLLEIFSNRINKKQKLCIDIKDYGFEKEHIKLVEKYNLLNYIIWISWIPQTLIELHKLIPNTSKVLSFIPLQKFYLMANILEKLPIIKIPFVDIVVMGKKYFNSSLTTKNLAIGFQHAYLAKELPIELVNLLKSSQGGICIQKEFFTKDIKEYCKTHNLILFLFSIKNKKEYYQYSKYNTNILFADTIIFNKSNTPNSHHNN